MTVSFLAMLPGAHQLNGVWLEAGRTNTRRLKFGRNCKAPGLKNSDSGWQETRFAHTFTTPPAFLTTIQTVRNERGLPSNSRPWFTVAADGVNVDGALVALEMSETTSFGK
ncbi:Hypothetical protein (Fragment), partial [Durusdinium trenchii]